MGDFKLKRGTGIATGGGPLKATLFLAVFVLSFWTDSAFARPPKSVIHRLCSSLLTKASVSLPVAIEGAPGLKLLSSEIKGIKPVYQALVLSNSKTFYPHELVSSARYAKLIHEQNGETLLMVPGIEAKDIPGFDGVIYDAEGNPVANYSVKTILGNSQGHGVRRAWDGISKAKRFSFPESWMTAFKLLYEDQSGRLFISDQLTGKELVKRKAWISKAFELFGIRTAGRADRPTRVVIDIQSDSALPTPHEIQTVRDWIERSNGLIEKVIFLKGDQVVEIR